MLKQAENLKVKKTKTKNKKTTQNIMSGLTRALKRVFPRTFPETAVLPRWDVVRFFNFQY